MHDKQQSCGATSVLSGLLVRKVPLVKSRIQLPPTPPVFVLPAVAWLRLRGRRGAWGGGGVAVVPLVEGGGQVKWSTGIHGAYFTGTGKQSAG